MTTLVPVAVLWLNGAAGYVLPIDDTSVKDFAADLAASEFDGVESVQIYSVFSGGKTVPTVQLEAQLSIWAFAASAAIIGIEPDVLLQASDALALHIRFDRNELIIKPTLINKEALENLTEFEGW